MRLEFSKTSRLLLASGFLSGLAVTLALKGCSPLSPSLQKAGGGAVTTVSEGTDSSRPAPADGPISVLSYRTLVKSSSSRTEPMPAPDETTHVVTLSADQLERFRETGKVRLRIRTDGIPRSTVGVFRVRLAPAKIEELGLEDFQTRFEIERASADEPMTWVLSAVESQDLLPRISAHLAGIELELTFQDEVPPVTIDEDGK